MINQKIPYLQANIYFFTKINFALCVFLYSIKNIPYLQAKFLIASTCLQLRIVSP